LRSPESRREPSNRDVQPFNRGGHDGASVVGYVVRPVGVDRFDRGLRLRRASTGRALDAKRELLSKRLTRSDRQAQVHVTGAAAGNRRSFLRRHVNGTPRREQ